MFLPERRIAHRPGGERGLHIRMPALVAALAIVLFGSRAGAVQVPPGFVVEDVTPTTTWVTPTAIAFLPDGRMLVAEKRGRVYAAKNGVREPNPLWSREAEVLNEGDRGLLDVAVDPNYATNRFVYFLYTVDPDSNGTDNNNDAFGRLTRYQVSAVDSTVLVNSSRTILIGATWGEGPVSCSPSHTVGALRFGNDGSLLVSTGDGASFGEVDQGGLDAPAFQPGRTNPYEDIGAFRAISLTSLCGKILRINPLTGMGYPSNPYWNGTASSVRSRVYAYGLRNPYRFTVKPGTGSTDPAAGLPGVLHIGDVGWNNIEDLNISATPGTNFGWPCFEGPAPPFSGYPNANPPHNGCNSFGTPDNPAANTAPVSWWHHTAPSLSKPVGLVGNTSTGGVFYTAGRYPAQYRRRLFHADYGGNWIRVLVTDSSYNYVDFFSFAEDMDGPVDLQIEPGSGDIVYVSINTNEIRRIRYAGFVGNSDPVVVASGTPTSGAAPLTVNFSSAGTFDPDDDPFGTVWLFGDGQGSTSPNPSHPYLTPGYFEAVLTSSDGEGGVGRDTVHIVVTASNEFPLTGVLDSFNRANGPIGVPWTGNTNGLTINAGQLASSGALASAVWNGAVFGPNQEAYITLDAITAGAPEHDLMLKVQGTTFTAGHIEVRYTAPSGSVQVATYTTATSWVNRGAEIPVTFVAGDVFGARAYQNGLVVVYRNGLQIGSADCRAWPFFGLGGRLGLTIDGANASRWNDFGGGDVMIDPNTPPSVSVLMPADSTFYAAGDSVQMVAFGTDAEDSLETLLFQWDADLHHNNHVHPSTATFDTAVAGFVAQNHDDGTGVWYRLRVVLTDSGGLTDTASVDIFPEVDLAPGPIVVTPSNPGTEAPAQYRFTIANHGRMPAPLFRWMLRAGGTLLAQGDTLIASQDSVEVVRRLPPLLAAGEYVLRLTVDTLRTSVETNEGNNSVTRALTVTGGPDPVAPLFIETPAATPGDVTALIAVHTNEPTNVVVHYGLSPALGDSATSSETDTTHVVPLDGLTPDTRYYFAVTARDTAGNPASAALDSFTTLTGPLSAGDAPVAFALSNAWPNPTRSRVSLMLDLPQPAAVQFAVLDLQGRAVWVESDTERGAGRWRLEWSGQNQRGGRAAPGVYYARVRVGSQMWLRRIALLQ